MRSTIIGLAAGLCLGIVGTHFLRPSANSTPDHDVLGDVRRGTRAGGQHDATRSPGLVGSVGHDETVPARLASIEDELRRLTRAVSALTNGAERTPGERPPTDAPRIPNDVSVETVRATWSDRLDRWEAWLRKSGPQDERHPVMWSRWEDLKRARRLLENARTLEDLRELSGGEFKITFKWPG